MTDVGPFLENSPQRIKDVAGLPAAITGKPKIFFTNQTSQKIITFVPIHP